MLLEESRITSPGSSGAQESRHWDEQASHIGRNCRQGLGTAGYGCGVRPVGAVFRGAGGQPLPQGDHPSPVTDPDESRHAGFRRRTACLCAGHASGADRATRLEPVVAGAAGLAVPSDLGRRRERDGASGADGTWPGGLCRKDHTRRGVQDHGHPRPPLAGALHRGGQGHAGLHGRHPPRRGAGMPDLRGLHAQHPQEREAAAAEKAAEAKREAQQKLREARQEVKETDAKGSFGVQVALADNQAKADQLAKKFKEAGYQVKTSPTSRGVRVIVGPERGKVAALALKDKINSDSNVNTTGAWVLYWR